MAYQNIEIGDRANTQYKEYICDSSADLLNIKEEFGSIAFAINDKKLFVCGSEGWKEV